MTRDQKLAAFRALHAQGCFLIPNPWDAGSARVLAALGFPALATTSAGAAWAIGRRDGEGALSRPDTIANARMIVQAVDVPVSADLEDGFGHAPEDCAATIRAAARAGLVGGSIEDSTGDRARPLHEETLAIERVAAAAEAARDAGFVLTARAEALLHGGTDLDAVIRRLVAFSAAGAEVLYAPGLRSLEQVRAVVAAVAPKPVNVLAGMKGVRFSRDDLAAAGVRRISVGGAIARAALSAVQAAGRELLEGRLDFVHEAMGSAEANGLAGGGAARQPQAAGGSPA